MEDLKKTMPSLDEQIKFVHDARRLLENNPDAEIVWYADSIDQLRAIETNLIALQLGLKIGMEVFKNIDVTVDRPLCSYPVGTEVFIQLESSSKSEWVNGHIVYYKDGCPVVMTYYGINTKILNAENIRPAYEEEVNHG